MSTRPNATVDSAGFIGDQVAAEMDASLIEEGDTWREHDLLIRRFQLAGLTPAEIAVVLSSKGLRVKMWHVSETFVRKRLKMIGLVPNASRDIFSQADNCYRARKRTA